jgi:hypothetical protein
MKVCLPVNKKTLFFNDYTELNAFIPALEFWLLEPFAGCANSFAEGPV